MRTCAALCLTAVLVVAGCSKNEAVAPLAATAGGNDRVAILTQDPMRWRHDPYEFVGMSVTGDRLQVTVRHGGGCAPHVFTLLITPVFMESLPVQMAGSLAHDAHGDLCRALLTGEVRIDLSPVKQAYRESYGAGDGVVHLQISGWRETVVYRF